jgi:hypothetical protein
MIHEHRLRIRQAGEEKDNGETQYFQDKTGSWMLWEGAVLARELALFVVYLDMSRDHRSRAPGSFPLDPRQNGFDSLTSQLPASVFPFYFRAYRTFENLYSHRPRFLI